MDLTSIFQFIFLTSTYLLACVEVGLSWRESSPTICLRAQFRHYTCNGGSLIRINTDQCKVSSAGRRQCKAKCNGLSTRDPNARFSLVEIGEKKCIRFADDRDGTKYALKVINGLNVIFEEQQCNGTAEDSFLFKEQKFGGRYQYSCINGTMLLGVPSNCNENLSLIKTTERDRRCSFRKLK